MAVEKKNREKKAGDSAPARPAVRTKGVKLDFSAREDVQYSRYYLGISRRYRVARYISILVLAAFLIVMLVFYRDNITYANLMYLARDLDADSKINVGVYNDISYTERLSYDFGFYRQRLAVATNTGFTLYSRTGSADLESSEVMQDPRLETGEKYALVYDEGSTSYSIFTTVARVLFANTEFEIRDCAMSDSGRYALLTGSDEAKALITVYSKDFTSITEYYKDKFVIDVALDKEGEHLAVASCDVHSSNVTGELMIGKVGTKDSFTATLSGMMPLKAEYTDDGRLVLICDTAILIYEGEKECARISFDGQVPGAYAVEGNFLAVSFPENVIGSENTVKIFDTAGKELYNVKISEKVTTIVADGEEAVYAVGDSAAVMISLENGKQTREALTNQSIGAVAVPGSLVVFSPEGSRSYFTD